MLLSEKDSVVYPRCLAPELRSFRFPQNVHRVPDYTGAGQEQKLERIRQIVAIATDHGYTHVFAGYGFMAEDAELVEAIERAGVGFMGPASSVLRRAGAKDEAKKLARRLGNAVIPGVDDVSARALLAKTKDRAALEKLARKSSLDFAWMDPASLEENAEALLQAGYAKSVELVTIADLQAEAERICNGIWAEYPSNRIRFKYIGGGGGKGQRVVAKAEEIAAAVMDVLRRVEGDRARLEPELPDRAQHRAHPPQRDPADRQRRLVPQPRRPRLLGADARAEADRGLAHAGAARERARARARQDAPTRCAATSSTWRAWRPRARSSAPRPGSTPSRPSSASSRASITSSWR